MYFRCVPVRKKNGQSSQFTQCCRTKWINFSTRGSAPCHYFPFCVSLPEYAKSMSYIYSSFYQTSGFTRQDRKEPR
ncbi:hypothetical protein CW304_33010 [Bacillus sp. UFRGS-B20]|nr:hypothetical protein CW304_33010 [Bacillus sp. UFRGS-B20]